MRAWAPLILLAACSHAAPPAKAAAPPPVTPVSESPACVEQRKAFLAELEHSRTLPCASDDQCVVITGPWTYSREDMVVANATDAADLESRIRPFVERCGQPQQPPSETYYHMVGARCEAAHCAEVSYDMHPDPL